MVDAARAVFWHIAGPAQAKFGVRLEDEQELLAALADLAIQTFAIESALNPSGK